jgi:hypothetical protein
MYASPSQEVEAGPDGDLIYAAGLLPIRDELRYGYLISAT